MKNSSSKKLLVAALASALMLPAASYATNGYFAIGYGSNSRGMAGVGAAIANDSLAASTNPAGMGMVGNRTDLGAEIFSPSDRSATTQFGNAGPGSGATRSQTSDRDAFLVPSFGYNKVIDSNTTIGVSVYGNGGMNTQYNPVGGANLFGAPGKLGVDLSQLIIAPTITRKLNDNHTIGASLLIGYQKFKAYGLASFCSVTANACAGGFNSAQANAGLTDQGYDSAYGAGVRVGWMGKVSPTVTMGAAIASKVFMEEFDKYNNLFAEQGDFDIPANASIGIAVQATPKLKVAADIQHIWYGDVKSIANNGPTLAGANPRANGQGLLGTDNGLGFGWEDMTIFKLGLEYVYNNKWTFRGGISHGDSPIPNTQLAFNVLAPAVIETHMTLGFTHKSSKNSAWTVAYMHAFDNKQTGTFPEAFGGTVANTNENTLQMEQNAIEVSYSWLFD